MKKTETILQEKIRKVLSKYGKVYRMNSGVFKTFDGRLIRCGAKGMSDLLFVGNGYVAWLECKTDRGKLSSEQLEFLENMQKLGHRAEVVKSVNDALRVINFKGDNKKMIKIDYGNLNENLIPVGQYEVLIRSAFIDATRGGTAFINIQFVVRNDVEQVYKNKYIFYQIWQKKMPNEQDKSCEGFSSKQLFKICKAVKIPEEKVFENLEEMLGELVGKPLLIGVKHEIYKEKTQEKISFMAATKFPEYRHEFKKDISDIENKANEITINSDYLPF